VAVGRDFFTALFERNHEPVSTSERRGHWGNAAAKATHASLLAAYHGRFGPDETANLLEGAPTSATR